MIVDRLMTFLAEKGRTRSRVGFAALSGSAVGKCPRELAYLCYASENVGAIEPAALARFGLGDSVHDSLRKLVAESGVDLPNQELEVVDRIPLTAEEYERLSPAARASGLAIAPEAEGGTWAWPIPGHIDGMLERPEGKVIVEIKSVSAYPWRIAAGLSKPKAGEGPISESYLDQATLYMHATQSRSALFVYQCIERDDQAELHPTFPFCQVEVAFDEARYRRIVERVKAVLFASAQALPPRPYEPVAEIMPRSFRDTGRKILPFPCNYCGFVAQCWPNATHDPEAPRKKTFVVS